MSAVPTAVDRGAPSAPAEWWEDAARGVNSWLVAHPRMWRALRVVAGVSRWLTLMGLLALVVVVPRVAEAMRLPASAIAGLVVITLLTRTRTLSAHAVLVLFSVSLPWSVVLGSTSAGLAHLLGLAPTSSGPMIALAGFVEEIGKLVPLWALTVAVPGRVRRFSLADWFVAGWALGTGFFVVEEFGRRIGPPSILQAIDELFQDRSRSWTPWHVEAWDHLDASFGGHFVVTSLVTTSVGLGFLLARHARRQAVDGRGGRHWVPVWRIGAWALPAVMLLWAIVVHLGNNAAVQSYSGGQTSSLAFGPGLYVFWVLTGKGHGAIALSVALLVVAWLVDSYRRAAAGDDGRVLVELPTPTPTPTLPGAASWPTVVRVLTGGAWAAVWFLIQDWALILAAHVRRGEEPRCHALRRGQAARMAVRAT